MVVPGPHVATAELLPVRLGVRIRRLRRLRLSVPVLVDVAGGGANVDGDARGAEPQVRLPGVAFDDDGLATSVVEPELVVAEENLELEAPRRRLERLDRRAVAELRRAEVGFGAAGEQAGQEGYDPECRSQLRRLHRSAAAAPIRTTRTTAPISQPVDPESSSDSGAAAVVVGGG
jgi:hypothetical protein